MPGGFENAPVIFQERKIMKQITSEFDNTRTFFSDEEILLKDGSGYNYYFVLRKITGIDIDYLAYNIDFYPNDRIRIYPDPVSKIIFKINNEYINTTFIKTNFKADFSTNYSDEARKITYHIDGKKMEELINSYDIKIRISLTNIENLDLKLTDEKIFIRIVTELLKV
jgi:hypothetical protein